MLLQIKPNLTPLQVYDIMASTAIDMGTPCFDFDSGPGLVDASAAVLRVRGENNDGSNDPARDHFGLNGEFRRQLWKSHRENSE